MTVICGFISSGRRVGAESKARFCFVGVWHEEGARVGGRGEGAHSKCEA